MSCNPVSKLSISKIERGGGEKKSHGMGGKKKKKDSVILPVLATDNVAYSVSELFTLLQNENQKGFNNQ